MVIVFPLLRTICTILIFNSILAVHTLRLCFQGTYNTGDLVKINEDKEQHIGIIQKVIKDAAGRSHHPVCHTGHNCHLFSYFISNITVML